MKPHHYVVEGPCRDYDYSTFCEDCNNDAADFASEWLAEVFDALDVGEETSVTMRVVEGALVDEECAGDSCKRAKRPAPHVVAIEPFGFSCLHCGEKLPLLLPISVDQLVKLERRFRSRHVDCPAPKPPQPQDGAK